MPLLRGVWSVSALSPSTVAFAVESKSKLAPPITLTRTEREEAWQHHLRFG